MISEHFGVSYSVFQQKHTYGEIYAVCPVGGVFRGRRHGQRNEVRGGKRESFDFYPNEGVISFNQ